MADPAFRGFVETTLDALLIFEGCKRGLLPKISRRLQDFEKRELVVSGAVFVFDEEETGIKRWTDGLTWSPSRTLGNFLVYRELDKKAALQKASATSGGDGANGEDEEEAGSSGKSRLLGGLTSKADPVADSSDPSRPGSSSSARRPLGDGGGLQQLDRARERALVGSLTSSYRFRADGLVKKTISLNGLHLIGYYRIEDVTSGRLRTPSSHPELVSIEVSSAFLAPALFRIPPIVEIGSDGQLRYKSEADAPLSPLTRSGSSQGFPTPGLSQVSWITSSASTALTLAPAVSARVVRLVLCPRPATHARPRLGLHPDRPDTRFSQTQRHVFLSSIEPLRPVLQLPLLPHCRRFPRQRLVSLSRRSVEYAPSASERVLPSRRERARCRERGILWVSNVVTGGRCCRDECVGDDVGRLARTATRGVPASPASTRSRWRRSVTEQPVVLPASTINTLRSRERQPVGQHHLCLQPASTSSRLSCSPDNQSVRALPSAEHRDGLVHASDERIPVRTAIQPASAGCARPGAQSAAPVRLASASATCNRRRGLAVAVRHSSIDRLRRWTRLSSSASAAEPPTVDLVAQLVCSACDALGSSGASLRRAHSGADELARAAGGVAHVRGVAAQPG